MNTTCPRCQTPPSPVFFGGKSEVTCRRAEKDDDNYNYARVGLLGKETTMEEVQILDRDEFVKLS